MSKTKGSSSGSAFVRRGCRLTKPPPLLSGSAGYYSVQFINALLSQQDNDDFCAVCNGSGKFLCCERCPRSFHFTCLDPPLEVEPEGVWFCRKCQAQANPPPKHPKGIWAPLLDAIDRRNPTSYRLPIGIREYFEGVGTGKYGEYVDAADVRRPEGQKNGYGDLTRRFQML